MSKGWLCGIGESIIGGDLVYFEGLDNLVSVKAGQVIWAEGENIMATMLKFADLDDKNISRIKRLEEDMDTIILALQAVHPFADLGDEDVERIENLERELGVVLLAYPTDVG